MEARLSQQIPDFLKRGATDPKRDKIVVVGQPLSGALVYRPAVWVHELECGRDMASRLRAAALTDFAMRQDGSRCAVFLVAAGNEAMQRFVEELGAIRQSDPGDILYTLTI